MCTSVLESQVSHSCHCDGAHESDALVLGSHTMPPRHNHDADVVLRSSGRSSTWPKSKLAEVDRARFTDGRAGGGIAGISIGAVVVGISSCGREVKDGPARQNSITSLDLRLIHVGTTALQEVVCELICFVRLAARTS